VTSGKLTPDGSTDHVAIDQWSSHRAKLKRAHQHFKQLERYVRAIERHHSYGLSEAQDRSRPSGQNQWEYRLELAALDRKESALLRVLVGDVLFNVRSALDHLAVALAPNDRKQIATFPITPVDDTEPVACPTCGRTPKNSWLTATHGMPSGAIEIMRRLQPGHGSPPSGQTRSDHLLNVLVRLQDTDKHQHLLSLATGLTDVALTAVALPGSGPTEVTAHGYDEPNDTRVMYRHGELLCDAPRRIAASVTGQLVVVVNTKEGDGYRFPEMASSLIRFARQAIQDLEPYLTNAP